MKNQSKNSIENENTLLLLASKKRVLTPDEDATLRNAVSNIVDWDHFSERTFQTNLAPLVKRGFAQISDLEIPESVLKSVKNYQQKMIMHNIRLYEALKNVGLALNDANIDFIPLKGMMLTEVVYGNIGLRQISDIDLLVKQEDVESCKELLIKMEWECDAVLSKNDGSIVLHLAHPYVFKKGTVIIELHQHIQDQSNSYTIDIADYWKRSTKTPFLNGFAYFLNPADLIQHLCVHTYKHLMSKEIKISSFIDFPEVIDYYTQKIDWDQLIKTSVEYNCLKEVQGILSIAKNYWEANVPEFVLRNYKSEDYKEMETIFLTRFIDPFGKMKLGEYSFSVIQEIKRATDKKANIRFFIDELFPSKKFMKYRYKIKNNASVYPYYLKRWAFAIGQVGNFIWWKLKKLTGNKQ